MNNGDIELFLNEYRIEYLSKESNENQQKLDQSTVLSLLKSMDTEHDRCFKSDNCPAAHTI